MKSDPASRMSDGHTLAERAQSTTESRLISRLTKGPCHGGSEVGHRRRLSGRPPGQPGRRARCVIWSSWKFRTSTTDLERLWAKIPDGVSVTVILEPTATPGCRFGLAPSTRRHSDLGATGAVGRPAGLLQQAHQDRPMDSGAGSFAAATPRRPPRHRQPRSGGITSSCCASPGQHGQAPQLPACASMHWSNARSGLGRFPRVGQRLEDRPGRLGEIRRSTGAQAPRAHPAGRLLIRSSAGLWREDKADELLAMADETWPCGLAEASTSPSWPTTSPQKSELLRQLDDEITAADKRIAVLMTRPTPRASSLRPGARARPLGGHLGERGRLQPLRQPGRRALLHRLCAQDRPVRTGGRAQGHHQGG